MAAEAHSLATKIIVTEMETMLREAWQTPAALRAHVLRYGPKGYDIINTDPQYDEPSNITVSNDGANKTQ